MPRTNHCVMFNLQKKIMPQVLEMQPLNKIPPYGYKILNSGYYYGQVTMDKNQPSLVCVNVSKKRPAQEEVTCCSSILRYLCCMTFADDEELETMEFSYEPTMKYKITVEIYTNKMHQLVYDIELLYAKGEENCLKLDRNTKL